MIISCQCAGSDLTVLKKRKKMNCFKSKYMSVCSTFVIFNLILFFKPFSANPMADRDRKKRTREGNKLKDRCVCLVFPAFTRYSITCTILKKEFIDKNISIV